MEPIEITCKVCFEQFDNDSHKPYLLNCGHTFCAQCLIPKVNELRQADINFRQKRNPDTERNLKEKQMCINRCENAITTYIWNDLTLNTNILKLAEQLVIPRIPTVGEVEDNNIKIGCCPNMSEEQFEQQFLAQLGIIPMAIKKESMADSFIDEWVITLKFVKYAEKSQAMKVLGQKILRLDQYESNIYIVVETQKDKQLPEKMKHKYKTYQFIMI